MARPHPSTPLTAVAAVLLTLTACTSDGNQDDGPVASPLGEQVGLGRIDYGLRIVEPTDSTAQNQGEVGQSIAQCMDEQGHQYTPTGAVETPETGLGPASRDYAATWGYGITTLAFSQQQVGPDLLGYTPTQPADNDPNIEHVNSLEPDQQAAWIEALTGQPPTDPDQPVTAADLAPTPASDGGCLDHTNTDTTTAGPGPQAFYTEFGDELEDLTRQVLNDPRITDHHDTIADCTTDQDVDYTPPQELYQRWGAELTAIADDITYPTNTDDDTGPPALSATGKARLKAAQNDETLLATTAHDCGGDPTTNTNLYTTIAAEHEQRFIDTHQDQLNTFNEQNNM